MFRFEYAFYNTYAFLKCIWFEKTYAISYSVAYAVFFRRAYAAYLEENNVTSLHIMHMQEKKMHMQVIMHIQNMHIKNSYASSSFVNTLEDTCINQYIIEINNLQDGDID